MTARPNARLVAGGTGLDIRKGKVWREKRIQEGRFRHIP